MLVVSIVLFAECRAVVQQQHTMMNDQVRARVCALLDGEITDAEVDLLARQVIGDERLSAEWARQCAIKQYVHDWVAGQTSIVPRADFAATVMQRIQAGTQPTVASPVVRPGRRGHRLLAGLSGISGRVAGAAIAASAAVVTLLVLQTQFTEPPGVFKALPLAALQTAPEIGGVPWLVPAQAPAIHDTSPRYLLTHDAHAAAVMPRGGLPYSPIIGVQAEWPVRLPIAGDGRIGDAASVD